MNWKKKITSALNEETTDEETNELIARYLFINGAIEIDKLVELLQNHMDINRTRLLKLLEHMDLEIYDDRIITFLPNMSAEVIEDLIRVKNANKEYRILDIDNDEEIESEFLCELIDCFDGADDKNTTFIVAEIIMMVFRGYYEKDYLRDVLKQSNALDFFRKLDKVINKYRKKVAIWVLNGFTLNDK